MKDKAKPKAKKEPQVLGRKTLYKPEYDEQAYKLCLLGATDKEVANFFNVTEQTVNNWKIDHPSFFESLKSGKVVADAQVANSLFKRATGYTVKETQLAQFQGEFTDQKDIDKHIPPETTATIFWLKNRQPEKWRDKQEIKMDGDLNIAPITWVENNSQDAEDN